MVERVRRAAVRVEGEVRGAIGQGVVVLVGVGWEGRGSVNCG